MYKLLIGFLILSSTSSFAGDCSKLAQNAVLNAATKQGKCSHSPDTLPSMPENYYVHNIVSGKVIEAKIIEVSFHCEAGIGAVVVSDWNCNTVKSVTFTGAWE